jgi:hypothetical protein
MSCCLNKEWTNIYSLVRLTLPGYNNFSRSLSAVAPDAGWRLTVGAETNAILAGLGEEEIGLETFGGLDEMIACIDFG